MWVSDNPRENLIVLGFCVGILAIAGIIHLVQKHKEKQEMKKFLQTHHKLQSEEISNKNMIHIHKN